jgi:hypothetical protein
LLRSLIDSCRRLANATRELAPILDLDARGLARGERACVYARNFGLKLNFVVDRDSEQRLILHRRGRGSHNGGATRHDTGGRRFQNHGGSGG